MKPPQSPEGKRAQCELNFMMLVVVVFYIVVLLITSGCASTPYNSTPRIVMQTIAIEFGAAKQVQRFCRAITKEENAIGCAMWDDESCRIYLPENTTNEILGHEMRHCLDGKWH